MLPCASRLEVLEGRVLLAAVTPDPSFGGDGTVRVPVVGSNDESARVVAVQKDGKVLVGGVSEGDGGDFLLVRLKPNGSRDRTFGRAGVVKGPAKFGDLDPSDIVVQPDGKILISGDINDRFTVVRLKRNGALDKSFAGDGIAQPEILPAPGFPKSSADAIQLMEDGRIVVAGTAIIDDGNDPDFVVARFKANGAVDKSFGGGDGIASRGGDEWQVTGDAVLDGKGGIIVAGRSDDSAVLVRFNEDGGFDTNFGIAGVATVQPARFGERAMLESVIVHGGKIIAAGQGGDDVLVAAFTMAGNPDTSFGDGDGRFDHNLQANGDTAMEIVPRTQGRFTVLAQTRSNKSQDGFRDPRLAGLYLLHLNPDGTWDTAAGGKVHLGKFSGGNYITNSDVAVGPSGSFIVLGQDATRLEDLLVMRVGADGTPVRNFGSNGRSRIDYRGKITARPAKIWQLDDGKLAVLANLDQFGKGQVLVRLNADGTPDKSFGTRGQVQFAWTDQDHFYDYPFALAEQSDGKLLLAAGTEIEGPVELKIMRLNRNGSLDKRFGDDGFVVLSDADMPELLQVLPDGKILVGADVGGGGPYSVPSDWGLRRLHADGSIDESFEARLDLRAYHTFEAAQPVSGGKLVLLGRTADVSDDWTPHEGPQPVNQKVTIVRLDADGSLDDSFGTGGVRYVEPGDGTVLAITRSGEGPPRIAAIDTGGDLVIGRVNGSGDFAWSTAIAHFGAAPWRSVFEPDGDLLLYRDDHTFRVRADGMVQRRDPVAMFNFRDGPDDQGRWFELADDTGGLVVSRYIVG